MENLYYLVRTPFVILFLIILIIFVAKKKRKKQIVIIAICVFIALYGTITCIPYENYFIRFKTADSAFQYAYGNKTHYILDNGNNAFIPYLEKRDDFRIISLNRDEKGWLIKYPFNYSTKADFFYTEDYSETYLVYEMPVENSIFIFVRNVDFENSIKEFELTDNRNSTFKRIENPQIENSIQGFLYYSEIKNDLEGYELKVNGELIKLFEDNG